MHGNHPDCPGVPLGVFSLCGDRMVDGAAELAIAGDVLTSSFTPVPIQRTLPSTDTQPATLRTAQPIIDAIWRLALTEIESLKCTDTVAGRKVTRLSAGERWQQAWTRDTSYAADLGLMFLYPDEIRASLDASVVRDPAGQPLHARQDSCRHFGGWPSLTDSIVWALAATEWRKAHGGNIEDDYQIVSGTLARAEAELRDPDDGLFCGVASFMESHSAYPAPYRHPDGPANKYIGKTKALSTNVLYVAGYRCAAWLAEMLGERKHAAALRERESALADAVNQTFFRSQKGRYSYFKDEHGLIHNRFEALGSMLACRLGVAPSPAKLLSTAALTPYGTPCLWPPYDEWAEQVTAWDPRATVDSYHNGMIWPFVEAYTGWIEAAAGNTTRLLHSIGALANLAGRELAHHEFHHWETGRPGGSRAQLWSAAGTVGLILRGVLGLWLDNTSALILTPNLPAALSPVRVSGIRYRDAILTITLRGAGTAIRAISLDGIRKSHPVLLPTLSGMHELEVELAP